MSEYMTPQEKDDPYSKEAVKDKNSEVRIIRPAQER
jgi:hypothetical protein